MSPRKLVEWALAVSVVIVCFLAVFAIVQDFYLGSFERFRTLPRQLQQTAFLIVAAVIPTFLIFFLRSTKGPLQFKALGVSFSGPSGQILLWAVMFLAVSVVLFELIKVVQ